MIKKIISVAAACIVANLAASAQNSFLSLEECLTLGLENNAAVRNSRIDLLSAREQSLEARWEYLPRVSASAFGYYSVNPLLRIGVKDIIGNSDAANEINNSIQEYAMQNGIKTVYKAFENGYGSSASLIQPIYAGGRIVNGNRLAALGVEAAALQLRISEKAGASEIESKYWTVVALQEKMTTLLQAKSLLDTLCRDAETAYSAGLVLASDVREVKSRVNELAAAEVKLRGGLRLAKMDLFNAIGYPYAILQLDSIILSDSLSDVQSPESYIVSDPSQRSDESRLLAMQVQARELEKKMSIGESLPQIMVGANYSYGNMLGNQDILKSNAIGFVSVQIPITELGKASHRAKRLDYEVQKAKNDRDFLDAQLELRLQMAELQMQTAWDSVLLCEDSLSDAQEDALRYEAEFKSGRITTSDYLKCLLDLRGAEEALISSRIEYRNAVRSYLDSL